jgi:hypothetical protein
MPTPYIRSQLSSGLIRLRVTPDEPVEGPPAIIEQRPRGSRRPHTDMTVAKVRHLIELTGLTYSEIAKKTGVGRASICATANGCARRTRRSPPTSCRRCAPAAA